MQGLKEEVLQYIWQLGYFSQNNLTTDCGKTIIIKDKGILNLNEGADFHSSIISIGGIIWAGSVEVHWKASDWFQHHHQNNTRYKNVILHVVYENDVKNSNSLQNYPSFTLSLNKYLDDNILHKASKLLESIEEIPCSNHLSMVSKLIRTNLLDSMIHSKLEQSTKLILNQLTESGNDWESIVYRRILRYFGRGINHYAFDSLAQILPFKVIQKHQDSLFQIESLLFGCAGFLVVDFEDSYPNNLKKEFNFLKKKYDLEVLDSKVWKFMRMRPNNFPTIRIAQFAYFISLNNRLFSRIIGDLDTIKQLTPLKASNYWDNHYRFDVISTKTESKQTGKDFNNGLLINVNAPILYAYGKIKDNDYYIKQSLILLEKIPKERNSILETFSNLGLKSNDAYSSQAILHLHTHYCLKKQCLHCDIGKEVIKNINL